MASSWPCLRLAVPLTEVEQALLQEPLLHLMRHPQVSVGSAARFATRRPINQLAIVATLGCSIGSADSHGSGLAG